MVSTTMMGWGIGVIQIIFLVWGIFLTAIMAKKMEGKLKKAILLIILSFVIFVGIGTGVLLTLNKSSQDLIWLSVAVIGTISSLIFFLGVKKLYSILTGVSEGEDKK